MRPRPAPRLLLASLALLACRDSLGPLRPDQQALATALTTAGILAGRVGGNNALVLAQIDKKGKLTLALPASGTAAYDAVGLVVSYSLNGSAGSSDVEQGWFNGVVAWTGLDLAAGTAEQVSTAGAEGSGIQVLSTGSVRVAEYANNRGGLAQFYNRTGTAFYSGTTGTYTVQAATFSDLKDCAVLAGGAALSFACKVATGTMTGTFNYDAQLVTGTGAPTYSQPPVSFNLPAIEVIISN